MQRLPPCVPITRENFVSLSLKRRREKRRQDAPKRRASGPLTRLLQPQHKRRRISRKQRKRELAARRQAHELLPPELWFVILCEHLGADHAVPAYFVCKTWAKIIVRGYSHPACVQNLGFEFLRGCVRHTRTDLMAWAHQRGWRWRLGAQLYAAEHGHLQSLRWLLKRQLGGRFSSKVMSAAIRGGQLTVLQWLYWLAEEQRCYRCVAPLARAVKHGRTAVVEWLIQESKDHVTHHLFSLAAEYGHAPVLKALYRYIEQLEQQRQQSTSPTRCQCCYPSNGTLLFVSAGYGHLDTFRYLREERGGRLELCMLQLAALNGHLPIVKYMYSQRPDLVRQWQAVSHAAKGGHMHIVRYLHDVVGQPLSSAVLLRACRSGDIGMVTYCLRNGVPVDREACSCAARTQNLEMIKLLYAHCHHRNGAGRDWSWSVIMEAATTNSMIERWYCKTYGDLLRDRHRTLLLRNSEASESNPPPPASP